MCSLSLRGIHHSRFQVHCQPQELLARFTVGFSGNSYLTKRQDEEAPKGCKVQKEYDVMWNRIRSDVLSGLRKYVHTRRLVVTGISLGGALAELSFVDIQASK